MNESISLITENISQIYKNSITPWMYLETSYNSQAIDYIMKSVKDELRNTYQVETTFLPNENDLKKICFNHIETYRMNVKPKQFYIKKLNSLEGYELMVKGRLNEVRLLVEKNESEINTCVEKEKNIFNLWATFLYLSLHPEQCNIEIIKYFIDYSDYDGTYGPLIMKEFYLLIQNNKNLEEKIKTFKK